MSHRFFVLSDRLNQVNEANGSLLPMREGGSPSFQEGEKFKEGGGGGEHQEFRKNVFQLNQREMFWQSRSKEPCNEIVISL